MILVRILGGIDLLAAIAFLMIIFGIDVFTPYLLFCAGLLTLKGFFVFTGELLSIVDLISAFLLLLSIFISVPVAILWIPMFLLLAKAVVSFI